MRPVKFKDQNTTLGKDRPDVDPLPARYENGIVTACFKLDEDELDQVKTQNRILIGLKCFNNLAQPVNVKADVPVFPLSRDTLFLVRPQEYKEKEAFYVFSIIPMAKAAILEHGLIWLSVATYGAPLQPILPSVLGNFKGINGTSKNINQLRFS